MKDTYLESFFEKCYNVAMLQCYNATMLQCFNASMLQCCNATMLQCYNASMLQCYNATIIMQEWGITSQNQQSIFYNLQSISYFDIRNSLFYIRYSILRSLQCLNKSLYQCLSLYLVTKTDPYDPLL